MIAMSKKQNTLERCLCLNLFSSVSISLNQGNWLIHGKEKLYVGSLGNIFISSLVFPYTLFLLVDFIPSLKNMHLNILKKLSGPVNNSGLKSACKQNISKFTVDTPIFNLVPAFLNLSLNHFCTKNN